MAMYKSETVDVDVDVTIEVADVIEFIEDHATTLELEQIREALSGAKRSLEDVMKDELLEVAASKFTLAELEQKLGGNKFQL